MLVLGLGLVRGSSRVRVKVRVSVMVMVSIRTRWVVNFALFRCCRPVIYTRPDRHWHVLTENEIENARFFDACIFDPVFQSENEQRSHSVNPSHMTSLASDSTAELSSA